MCHGDQLQGVAQGTPLINNALIHGDSIEELSRSISKGYPGTGMPAWSGTLTDAEIKNLALYVSESRSGLNYLDFNYDTPFVIPEEKIESELHSFKLETVIDDLDPLPFSIAPIVTTSANNRTVLFQ